MSGNAGTGSQAFTYDALRRVTKATTIGTSVDTYSYLGSTKTAWQIANAGGSGITTKSALDATGARTAVTGNALTGYLGFDLHGNTVLAENGSKVITDALRYDAWGELIASTTSALPTPWRYQGRLDVGPDASNPLYDFGARAYRPVTGAFTSLDSYAGQAIDPLSMNRFLYAEANPSSFVDPTGHGVDCGMGEQCSATDRSNDLAASAARTAPKPATADGTAETAHIKMKAGGAVLPAILPYSNAWQDLTDRCLTGNKLDPAVGAACDAVDAGPVDLSLDRIGPILHDDLVAISVTTGGAALTAATGSLVFGPGAPIGEGAAAALEFVSLATNGLATGADCINHHDTECAIGVTTFLAGSSAFGFRGLGAAGIAADDVARAVNWFSELGANGLTLGGVLNSIFGAPAR